MADVMIFIILMSRKNYYQYRWNSAKHVVKTDDLQSKNKKISHS